MSHFSVLVPASDEKRLKEMLIPYYELGTSRARDEEVKPYLEYNGEYWYNPNARWDWYEVGGRFTGLLADGLDPTTAGSYDFDSPLAGQVSWGLLRRGKERQAEESWSDYLADCGAALALAYRWLGLVYHLAWPLALRFKVSKKLNDFFWSRMGTLSKTNQNPFWDYGVEAGESRRKFLERKGGALTWALVTLKGEWLEKAQMGWWGLSSDYQGRRYFKQFWEEVLSWPPDQRVYVIDCHI